MAPTPVLFPAVKAVLDKFIADWSASAALQTASAKGQRLIQPDIIGRPGLGNTANLVVDLTTGLGQFPKMPLGGLDSNSNKFLDPNGPEIKTIVNWIEGGCKG